jgi:hypothetical protein
MFGEDLTEFKNGKPVDTSSSWKAGQKGAQAVIVMKGQPKVGDEYWTEYIAGDAEVKAKVISTTEQVKVRAGTFNNAVMTEETSPLEPSIVEHKYYASGVGFVRSVKVRGESGEAQLVEYTP